MITMSISLIPSIPKESINDPTIVEEIIYCLFETAFIISLLIFSFIKLD